MAQRTAVTEKVAQRSQYRPVRESRSCASSVTVWTAMGCSGVPVAKFQIPQTLAYVAVELQAWCLAVVPALGEVADGAAQHIGVVLEPTQRPIAVGAQDSPDLTGVVVVVDDHP